MVSKTQKEILLLLKAIHDEQIEENKKEKRADLQRQMDLLKGELEHERKMRKAMERYLRVELLETHYKKIK